MPSTPAPADRDAVLPEGLEAGMLAALVVAVIYAVHDALNGYWLYTPAVLGTLLLDGPEAAVRGYLKPTAAAIYHAVHFAVWCGLGFAAAAVLQRARGDAQRVRWYLLGIAGVLVAASAALDLWVRGTPIGRLHLWLGSLVGSVTLLAMLRWRHPELTRNAPD